VLEEGIRARIENLRLVLLARSADRGKLPSVLPIRIEDFKGSRQIENEAGCCTLIERTLDGQVDARALNKAADDLLGREPEEGLVFLDLETTGFSATPLFLAGVLCFDGADLEGKQLLAADYSQEGALIVELDRIMSRHRHCITFNGKSFDMPYLRERAKYHRLVLKADLVHFDLLHHARRMWRHRLPNCRLTTLEWFILGRRRAGDVPSWEVPCIYHDFVHTRDARRLEGVLRHNMVDILSMAELCVRLAEARGC
jgi:hypothetical protein